MGKLYIIACCMVCLVSQAQIITFADSDFKMKLVNSGPNFQCAYDQAGVGMVVDANGNGQIEVNEVANIYQLYLTDHNIENFAGLEYFTNLRSLVSIGNAVGTLNLSAQPHLKNLWCNDSQLSSIVFHPAANLSILHCYNNNIADLSIAAMNNLVHLNCAHNVLTTIDVSGFPLLQIVDCSHNLLTSLNVSGDVSLQTLYCSHNALPVLDLSGLSSINNIDCGYNEIAALDASSHGTLYYLECSFNQMTSLNVAGCSQMHELFCGNNLLTSLDTAGLTIVNRIYCDSNLLTGLSLSDNFGLRILLCGSNQLSSLDFNGLGLLTALSCSDNLLTSLDLSQQPIMFSLECNNNNLQTLYLKNTSLESILAFDGNPNLGLVCADDAQLGQVQELVSQYGYANCSVSSNCGLSVQDFDTAQAVISPNPVQDMLMMNFAQPAKFTIYNAQGQLVLQFEAAGGPVAADVSGLEAGIYLLSAEVRGEHSQQKFVKL